MSNLPPQLAAGLRRQQTTFTPPAQGYILPTAITPEAWTLHTGVRMHLLSLGVKPCEIAQLDELVQRAIKNKHSPINRLGPQRPQFRILMRHTARKRYRKGASAKMFGCVPFSGRHGQVQPYTTIFTLPLYDYHGSRSQDPWTLLWQVKAVDLDTNPY